MVSGRIAIIDSEGKIYASTEFDDHMSPSDLGEYIIEVLNMTKNINSFNWVVTHFNDDYFRYDNVPLTFLVSCDWFNTRHDYENKWASDYVYIKNLSTETKYFVTPDGFVALPPNEILTLNFGKLIDEDENKLVNINVGDIITVADIEWIILKKTDNSLYCLTKNIIDTMRFSTDTADYSKAEIRTYLQGFAKRIKDKVEEDALIPITIDLTTNEGKTDYGTVTDDIGFLTESQYIEFKPIIEKFPVKDWWWLATADSRWYHAVRCVNDFGTLNDFIYCFNRNGVRPFCIFSSKIY